jgi:hypothetical protein
MRFGSCTAVYCYGYRCLDSRFADQLGSVPVMCFLANCHPLQVHFPFIGLGACIENPFIRHECTRHYRSLATSVAVSQVGYCTVVLYGSSVYPLLGQLLQTQASRGSSLGDVHSPPTIFYTAANYYCTAAFLYRIAVH